MRQLERMILLQMVDTLWKEHLLHMDHLREGIGLRGYGQKNPLNEYKREGYNLFRNLIEAVKLHTVANLMRIQLVQDDELATVRGGAAAAARTGAGGGQTFHGRGTR